MTVCIPLTIQVDYSELRFSLRSIEKYLPSVTEIIIVGDHVPEWINNVTQIHLPDIKGRKQLSIRRKILVALEYAEEILFFNDDMYLLKPIKEFPYYYHGYLQDYPESGSKPLLKQLQAMGKSIKHYDGHYSLIYQRDKFKEAMQHFTDECIIKSAYCNYWNIEGTLMRDCKLLKATKPEVIREFMKDKPVFSTGVYSLPSAIRILQELFPEPSKYEI